MTVFKNNNQNSHKRTIIELFFFIYIVFGFLILDSFYAFERFKNIGLNVQGHFGLSEYIRQFVFIFEYCLAFACIYFLTKINKKTAFILIAVLWLLTTIDLVAHSIYGRPADIDNISVLNASVANIGDAFQEYQKIIWIVSLQSLVFFIPIFIKTIYQKKIIKIKGINFLFFILLSIIISFYGIILTQRGSPALIGFPKGFSYGIGSIYINLNNFITKPNQILESDFQFNLTSNENTNKKENQKENKDINHMIVIVDESVEYSYFSKLFNQSKFSYIDYGVAYSGANCSASSNYIIRKGFWNRNHIQEIDMKEVKSLFEIAKNKGFKTSYIDNQQVLKDPTIRNYITDSELKLIDHIVQNDQTNQYERDYLSIEQISELTQKNERNFIFVNKIGSHFPYQNTIHPNLASDNKEKNYITSVQINSVDFLWRLQNQIPENTVIFYTSDHGQNLQLRGSHCNTGLEASNEEYSVPFLVLSSNSFLQTTLINQKNHFKNKLTHLEFSESIRNLLGVEIKNAPSLFKPDQNQFNYCGLYGQPKIFLGQLPKCKILINQNLN